MNYKLYTMVILSSMLLILSCTEDDNTPINPNNNIPQIRSLTASPALLFRGESAKLACIATDEDNDILTYSWSAIDGVFINGTTGSSVTWKAPETFGDYDIEISVSDDQDVNVDTLTISVIEDPCKDLPTITYAGKIYNTVQIGKQCWLKENLNIGKMINDSLEMENQDIIEKYCYDNDSANCEIYGGLYQWREAMQYAIDDEGTKGICPEGWHIPTIDDLRALKDVVNDDGNALKAIGQGSGLGTGTNTSGFSALLSGQRFDETNFGNLYDYSLIWSSKKDNFSYDAAYYLYLNSEDNSILLDRGIVLTGVSVRCLKD